MPRILAVVVLSLLCISSAIAQSTDPRLMSDADYKTLLSQIETALPKWETALKNIDPAKNSQVSYAVGKLIMRSRDIGLSEIEFIPSFAASQRQKRTVYGELAISRFLESLYDSIEEEVGAEAIGNVTLSNLEKVRARIEHVSNAPLCGRNGESRTARERHLPLIHLGISPRKENLMLYALLGFFIAIGLAVLLGWSRGIKNPAMSAWVWIGAILLLLLVRGWGGFDLFHWTPLLSYIPHTVESSITVNQDWIVGESKECTSVIIPSVLAKFINKKAGYAVLSFHCDDGPFRDMKVRIFGRTEQPEHKVANWRCTRESEGFTCRQTGAE